jgi:hypothetical protein
MSPVSLQDLNQNSAVSLESKGVLTATENVQQEETVLEALSHGPIKLTGMFRLFPP